MTLTDTLQPVLEKKFPAALVAASLLLATPALAAPPTPKSGEYPVWMHVAPAGPFDHLVPDDRAWGGASANVGDDYAAIVQAAMPEVFAPTVRLRVLILNVMPGSEYGLALEQHGNRWQLRGAESTSWLWAFSQSGRDQEWALHHKRVARGDFRKVYIRRCEAALSGDVATRVVAIWDTMLKGAKRAEFDRPHPADAPLIHYTANIDGKIFNAAPPENSGKVVNTFMAIGAAMGTVCEKPTRSNRRELEEAVNSFHAQGPRK